MSAKVIPLKQKQSVKQMIDEIHKQFAYAEDADKKTYRARIRAGLLLNELRKRVEAGEVGEGVNWWEWYDANFARSQRDARVVMKIAADDNPEAAAQAERDQARAKMQAHRARKRSNVTPQHSVVEYEEDNEDENVDLVDQALTLVEEMSTSERRRFFAELRSKYANQYKDN